MQFLFVGERPSDTAVRNNWTWKDGRLAAKQLFDALTFNNIDPADQWFTNIVEPDCIALCLHDSGRTIVSMGKPAHDFLTKHKIPHRIMVHPAARGHIRKKAIYFEHVRLVLKENV